MKPVVEPFEIRQNNFMRWLFLSLVLLSIFGLIVLPETDDKRWIAAIGIPLFGLIWFFVSKLKITVHQAGFEIKTLRGTDLIAWKDITALHLGLTFNGHGADEQLTVTANGQNHFLLPAQFQVKPMRRLFEILHEQCPTAVKNVHFIRQATGEMNWRNKLKIFR
jgi:hypothetical protein